MPFLRVCGWTVKDWRCSEVKRMRPPLSSMDRNSEERNEDDLDTSIRRLAVESPGNAIGVRLTGVYHNLLRRWAEM